MFRFTGKKVDSGPPALVHRATVPNNILQKGNVNSIRNSQNYQSLRKQGLTDICFPNRCGNKDWSRFLHRAPSL